jgi:hypothetical protein
MDKAGKQILKTNSVGSRTMIDRSALNCGLIEDQAARPPVVIYLPSDSIMGFLNQ